MEAFIEKLWRLKEVAGTHGWYTISTKNNTFVEKFQDKGEEV